jgi:hypothetical protein
VVLRQEDPAGNGHPVSTCSPEHARRLQDHGEQQQHHDADKAEQRQSGEHAEERDDRMGAAMFLMISGRTRLSAVLTTTAPDQDPDPRGGGAAGDLQDPAGIRIRALPGRG